MDKTRFGQTELMVSKIAFGGIPIQRLSTPDAVEVVRGALKLGVNFIDTANGYSDSEIKIGIAIKDIPRENLVIATKSGARDKKTFLQHLDLSLKQLGTDYIDIYQHHGIYSLDDYDTIMGEGGAYEGMTEAIRAGKVRFPAFSSHSVNVAVEIMKKRTFAVVQLPFNFVDDEAAEEAIPLAKDLDIGFICMKPLGGGLLHDAGLSIRYLSQFESIVPDPGIETLSEIEEIVRVSESGLKFTAEDAKAVKRMRAELGHSWCHRCDYCQPCHKKIRISGVLTIDSMIKRLPHAQVVGMAAANMEAARECTGCGECVARCPYQLNIPELIKEKLVTWSHQLALHL